MLRSSVSLLASSRRGSAAAAANALHTPSFKSQAHYHQQHQQQQQQQSNSTVSSSTSSHAANVFKRLEQQMIRSFRLDQVLSQVSQNDIVVARQDCGVVTTSTATSGSTHCVNNSGNGTVSVVGGGGTGGRYSFIGFKDICSLDVSRSLLLVPEHMRHFHTVCAREGAPCDFYSDIDLSAEADGEDTLLQVTDRLNATLASLKFGAYDTIVLTSQHRHKQSFHVHVRGVASAFSDFRAVRGIADSINLSVGSPVIDMSCYRYNGMLRTAFCAKLGGGSIGGINNSSIVSHLVPYEAKDAELRRRLKGMRGMSAEQLFEASLVNRQIPTESFGDATPLRLFSGVGRHSRLAKVLRSSGINTCEPASNGDDAAGDDDTTVGMSASEKKNHRFLREDIKWLRYKEAVKKVRQLPLHAAEDYSTWISVGLALHSFGTENHIHEEWVRFSAKCPEKFSREQCLHKWMSFNASDSGNNDVHNWRRGYNYLTSTVWRQFGLGVDVNTHRPRL